MKRRIALQHMAAVAGGLLTLPAWATSWNSTAVLPLEPYLSAREDKILAEIVETIIPATDTPGAKALHVHSFIQKMIKDCHEEEVQQNTVKGLNKVDEMARKSYNQPFEACTTAQRMDLLSQMEKSTESQSADFFKLIKDLTIQGYMTSEYVMTKHMNYTMVPGHYYGCVPVATK